MKMFVLSSRSCAESYQLAPLKQIQNTDPSNTNVTTPNKLEIFGLNSMKLELDKPSH